MDVDQDIMDVIKTARLKKGYTQEYVAKRVYLSAKAYSKIETGKNRLRVDNLKAICDVLKNSDEITFVRVFILFIFLLCVIAVIFIILLYMFCFWMHLWCFLWLFLLYY